MSVQPIAVAPADIAAGDFLDEGAARALTARIRTHLKHLDSLLLAAWRGRVWTALGHATWDAWVTAELGTVRLRLPVEQRRAVATAWRAEGMSQRAIATGLGVSKGTVAADLAASTVAEGLAVVTSLDGRHRPAMRTRVTPLIVATQSKQARALECITSAGEVGVTVPELMQATSWTWSQASACASRLNRSLDAGGGRRIERLVERRDGHAVYVAGPLDRGGDMPRVVLQPGERLRRAV